VALAELLKTQGVLPVEPSTSPEPETPTPFNANLAASVFGAKHEPATPGGYAPQAPAATDPPLITTPPAPSVGGGTPGSAAVPLDSKGRPWDARIHSSSHEKLAKTGEWKVARNKDPALVVQVLAELDAAIRPVQAPAPNVQAPYTAPAAFVTEPVYTPPAPVGPQYSDVVSAITGAIASGKIPPATIGGMLAHFGVKDIVDLENHATQWPTILSEIKRLSGV
jgi:hypothetical protein